MLLSVPFCTPRERRVCGIDFFSKHKTVTSVEQSKRTCKSFCLILCWQENGEDLGRAQQSEWRLGRIVCSTLPYRDVNMLMGAVQINTASWALLCALLLREIKNRKSLLHLDKLVTLISSIYPLAAFIKTRRKCSSCCCVSLAWGFKRPNSSWLASEGKENDGEVCRNPSLFSSYCNLCSSKVSKAPFMLKT